MRIAHLIGGALFLWVRTLGSGRIRQVVADGEKIAVVELDGRGALGDVEILRRGRRVGLTSGDPRFGTKGRRVRIRPTPNEAVL